MKAFLCGIALAFTLHGTALASDELAQVFPQGGDKFNYVLTTRTPATIKYAVILMPGSSGRMNPHMEGVNIAFSGGANFLIRSRETFAGPQFVAASTDATTTPARILAIVQDLEKRYGKIAIYVIGTSRSTESTMSLAKSLDGQVAGFVHSSSMNAISSFDPRALKSRNLIVLHRMDACRVTSPSAGASSHSKYGTELIEMDGGKSTGDDCEAFAHHGYYGIEAETVAKIEDWILAGK
jgi:hypothetical protein